MHFLFRPCKKGQNLFEIEFFAEFGIPGKDQQFSQLVFLGL